MNWVVLMHLKTKPDKKMHVHANDDLEKELSDILALAAGDVEAFTRLYQRYHRVIHSNILKLVRSPEASAEVLQDVFVTLWQHRDRIDTDRSLGGWLFVVSYNQALNRLRHEVKDSLVFIDTYPIDWSETSSDATEQEHFEFKIHVLDQAVSELPKRKREVFRMCRFEGISKEDVAEKLGLSRRTVENYLKDANRMIKEYVWEKHPECIGKLSLTLLSLYLIS